MSKESDSVALAIKQRKADLEEFIRAPFGRRIMKTFFAQARVQPFTGTSNSTMYNQGQIDFCRRLLEELQTVNLELYQQAEREFLNK
jgi:hypothetical protein